MRKQNTTEIVGHSSITASDPEYLEGDDGENNDDAVGGAAAAA